MSEANTGSHDDRRNKLEQLRALGIDPWPNQYRDRIEIAAALPNVEQQPSLIVRVAGRIAARRDMGASLVFFDLVDQSGRLQVMVRKDVGETGHTIAKKLIQLGDIVGFEGTLARTKTGEPTVFATHVEFLSKSLREPPEKRHGVTDIELRYRYRHLDLMSHPEVRATFVLRSRVIQGLRQILATKGFLEVETPMLHPIAGGAAARPFTTHHNALDMDLYLRIAPELYLKRLLVGGFEKVFEIGRVFRNEGISPRHNPEFTMMELYWAYVDYRAVMDLTEELFVTLAKTHTKDGTTQLGERVIDLNGPYKRATYHDLVGEHAKVDPNDENALRRRATELGLKEVANAPGFKVLEALFEMCVEPTLIQPTFVTHYPTAISPLSKPCRDRPELVERFEFFMNGWELANAFSELNDPIEQLARFEAQVATKDPEAPAEVDYDYVRALESAMPPAGGLGLGIDRLCMVLSGNLSIRETILFPLRRPLLEQSVEADVASRAAGDPDSPAAPAGS
ncbi:MAG: lysine--tRNA ligase [Planctomycetes bacterium]|nr:lysine--tRNA ligase [Planctomycetota bacterium]